MWLHLFSLIKLFDLSLTGSEIQSKLWMFEYTTSYSSVKDWDKSSDLIWS